jgi:hypothetical protein
MTTANWVQEDTAFFRLLLALHAIDVKLLRLSVDHLTKVAWKASFSRRAGGGSPD